MRAKTSLGWWPQLRTALILMHVAAVLLLSLPSQHRLNNRQVWNSQVNREEMAGWAAALRSVGLDWTREDLTRVLWDFTQDYLRVRSTAIRPVLYYVYVSGMGQGWRMFSNPQRFPARLQVEIRQAGGSFEPVFVARSADHEWRRRQFDHNRFRKLVGRFGRNINRQRYSQLARWIAARLAQDYPAASHARALRPEER